MREQAIEVSETSEFPLIYNVSYHDTTSDALFPGRRTYLTTPVG